MTNNLNFLSSGTSFEPWYYARDYNSGWPKLRVFIHVWTKIYFVSNNTSFGTVSSSSIKIPTDYVSSITYSSTSTYVNILDQRVDTTELSEAKFSEWVYEDFTFTAIFIQKTFLLEFGKVLNVDPVCIKGSFEDSTTKIKLSVVESVKLGFEYKEGKTIIYYEINDYRVEYSLDLKYTMFSEAD